MKSATRFGVVVLLGLCGLLGACSETRFKALPASGESGCDARWKGLWVPQDEPKGDTAVYVDTDCRLIIFDHPDRGGALRRVALQPHFIHLQHNDYLAVAAADVAPLVELPPVYGVDPPPSPAYFLMRYRVGKGDIKLYPVDSERMAKHIIDGSIKGTVSKTANELHVFVGIDAAAMLELLHGASIFANKADIEMIRSTRSVDEFERLVKPPKSAATQ